jgi:hypothetical protein
MPNSLEFKWDLMFSRISAHLRQPLNSTGWQSQLGLARCQVYVLFPSSVPGLTLLRCLMAWACEGTYRVVSCYNNDVAIALRSPTGEPSCVTRMREQNSSKPSGNAAGQITHYLSSYKINQEPAGINLLPASCWLLAWLIHRRWRWRRLRNVGWLSIDNTTLYPQR